MTIKARKLGKSSKIYRKRDVYINIVGVFVTADCMDNLIMCVATLGRIIKKVFTVVLKSQFQKMQYYEHMDMLV